MAERQSDMQVGKRIRSTRLHRGLSQSVVARRAGIDSSYLSRLETGKVHPTVRTALRIAEALKVSLNDLLGASPPELHSKPCPVSRSGRCLLDLMDTGPEPRWKRGEEVFTPRQIRLFNRFTLLLERGGPGMQKGFEALFDAMLAEMQQDRGRKIGG